MRRSRRRILYITGTRADFGLMRSSLEYISKTHDLELLLLVTGMHLLSRFGRTITEVEASGLLIAARVRMLLTDDSGSAMAQGVGLALVGIARALETIRPDIVLLLGDRGEMLAGALAAVHMNLTVAHIHGGDVSGTVDDSVRNAISKLAHVHLAATAKSADRLRRMGESPSRIHVVGAPGIDDILSQKLPNHAAACRRYRVDPGRPYLMMIQHPVTQEMDRSERQIKATLNAVRAFGMPVLIGEPNSDAGRSRMLRPLAAARRSPLCRFFKNIPRSDYLALLAGAAALIGNSSSGIIEAASMRVPVINIGNRQAGRERGINVIDVSATRNDVSRGLHKALFDQHFLKGLRTLKNPYGEGGAGPKMARILRRTKLGPEFLVKGLEAA